MLQEESPCFKVRRFVQHGSRPARELFCFPTTATKEPLTEATAGRSRFADFGTEWDKCDNCMGIER